MNDLINLLVRHVRDGDLSSEEWETLYVLLYEFWSRDPYARRWAGARKQQSILEFPVHWATPTTVSDIINDLIETVLQRQWPTAQHLDALTSGFIANQLRYKLLTCYRDGNRYAERLGLERNHDEPSLEPSEGDVTQFGVEELEDADAPVERSTPRVQAGFEGNCEKAAIEFIASRANEPVVLAAIDYYVAPKYLKGEDGGEPPTQKELGKLHGLSPVKMTRLLQRAGVNLKRAHQTDPTNPKFADRWRKTFLGSFALDKCQATNLDEVEIALLTLCECNRRHLEALKVKETPQGLKS